MKLKLLVLLYLGLWVSLGAVLAYFGVAVGIPVWATAVTAFVVFFFVNGTAAYVLRSRQLRREGKTPPAYARYMFQTQEINGPIPIPGAVRVVLGLIVILGAGLFILGGGVFLFAFERPGYLVAGCLFLVLGLAFAYVGYRVIRMNRPNQRLFGKDREPGLPSNAPQPTPNGSAAERGH